jgi:hypothetical protein
VKCRIFFLFCNRCRSFHFPHFEDFDLTQTSVPPSYTVTVAEPHPNLLVGTWSDRPTDRTSLHTHPSSPHEPHRAFPWLGRRRQLIGLALWSPDGGGVRAHRRAKLQPALLRGVRSPYKATRPAAQANCNCGKVRWFCVRGDY